MTDTDFHPTMIDNHPGALVNLTHAEKRWWLLHQVYSPPAQPATEDSTPIVVARRKNGTGSNLDLSSVSVDTSAFTSLPGIAATVKIATNNSMDAIVSMPDIKSIFSEVRENLPLPVSQKIESFLRLMQKLLTHRSETRYPQRCNKNWILLFHRLMCRLLMRKSEMFYQQLCSRGWIQSLLRLMCRLLMRKSEMLYQQLCSRSLIQLLLHPTQRLHMHK
jgi:hypothetical protein